MLRGSPQDISDNLDTKFLKPESEDKILMMEGTVRSRGVLNLSKEPKYLDLGFTDYDIECLNLLYPKIKINVVENYGSIRKIIPTLKLFTNNIIITVDDDIIYDKI